ncbi:hypothetical protein [Enterocloster clostridioformis]|uniref:hypothetical protein n=1 Tax=Enterocloster clostridioformis TaxID=1531 RepID=UPI0003F4E074|nr:hypothetical protein [Enterocloster clostridioformis]
MEGLFSDIAKYSDKMLMDDIAGVVSLSRKFAGDYNLSVLEAMSMEDYAIGHGDHLNFCYRIERELMRMGDIRGLAGSQKFGVWYSKKAGEYQNTGKYGGSPEEAWAAVKAEIISLVRAGAKEDYEAVRESMLSPLFRYKILAVYYPDQYITIFSDEHLSYFCEKLEIQLSPKGSASFRGQRTGWDSRLTGWTLTTRIMTASIRICRSGKTRSTMKLLSLRLTLPMC